MTLYPKRLIEVDLPIKKISTHARREKSIRHGHISTLHIWWARRPLAACRAVICAALWPDPADELCPQPFREAAAKTLVEFAEQVRTDFKVASLIKDHWSRWHRTNETSLRADDPACWLDMRYALLDFIADFANWDASTVPAFLNAARALTQAAHESLGGIPGTRPLVVDPFAGGGTIPLEALRVGADAYASDLNPVAVLLNKVVLEYIPKYGQHLADEVRKWGQWIKERAKQELAEFYPRDSDGAMSIAYLWARTIISEAPDDGTGIPIEVPLIRSLWLAKKKGCNVALRWKRNSQGRVQTETIEVTYANDVTRIVRRPLLEIFDPKNAREVENGTVARGAATCPVTGYTTPVESVRRQLKERRGGATDARLFAVVTIRAEKQGRFYRVPTECDLNAIMKASEELVRQENSHTGKLNLVPSESISLEGTYRIIKMIIYGATTWSDLFSSRQLLSLTTLTRLICEVGEKLASEGEKELMIAVQTCLALALNKQADSNSSLCSWRSTSQDIGHTFGRQALPMMWDFVEGNILSGATRDWLNAIEGGLQAIKSLDNEIKPGQVEQATATTHPLPNDAVNAFITDPPYYHAIAYAVLSDFFYVWLRRTMSSTYPDMLERTEVPKSEEIIVDLPHALNISQKDIVFYERELTKAFIEGCRIIQPDGIGTIVFASKTTASWEAFLQAVVDAGWIITGSWPVDTEMQSRVAAIGQARLASSIHLVCRPRQKSDHYFHTNSIGDWRDVLQELPERIHSWLPRLANEGIVGADAIFSCLGPALEIFSRYTYVEKASGEKVKLKEYLEHVWAAVAKEALNTIFQGADTTGFEEDARLTAIWFWTLKETANGNGKSDSLSAEDKEADEEVEEDEQPVEKKKISGYIMEYDAARKLAQGLGADLAKLSKPGGIITIKGNIAALNGIAHRENHLIGRQLSFFGEEVSIHPSQTKGAKSPRSAQMKLVESREDHLRGEEITTPSNPVQPFLPSLQPTEHLRSLMDRLLDSGVTVLDRLHQAMLLFGRSQTALLGPFLQATHMGSDLRFWRLANALSALYPPQSEEKRWVDGVLGRKKALGY